MLAGIPAGLVYRDGKIGALHAGALYHGGGPGLAPGDVILPPAQTGMPRRGDEQRDYDPHQPPLTAGQAAWNERESECVFIGSRRRGVQFAALHAVCGLNDDLYGTLYEVRPAEDAPVLPDFLSPPFGDAWIVESALVVRVIDDRVTSRTAAAMGMGPPVADRVPDATWECIERYHRLLARARKEGRQITGAEYAAFLAEEAGARRYRRATGLPSPERLAAMVPGL